MTEVATWLTQHNIKFLTVGATVAALILAFIVILIVSRLLRQWLTYLQARLHLSYDTATMIPRLITAGLSVCTDAVFKYIVTLLTGKPYYLTRECT